MSSTPRLPLLKATADGAAKVTASAAKKKNRKSKF